MGAACAAAKGTEMRRWGLLGVGLLLSGCSGLGHFFGDTETLPGQNPNAITGSSENLLRSRGQDPAAAPIAAEPGNVWPGPPQPLPTLSDVAKSGGELDGGLGGAAGGANTLKSGGSLSVGEQQSIHNGAPLDDSGFSGGGGGGLAASVPDPTRGFQKQHPPSGSSGDIIIPNGDGTSTVISPDGSVKTVKGTPK